MNSIQLMLSEIFDTVKTSKVIPFPKEWFGMNNYVSVAKLSDETSIIIYAEKKQIMHKESNSMVNFIEIGFERLSKLKTMQIGYHLEKGTSSNKLIDGKLIPSVYDIINDGKDNITGDGLPFEALSIVKSEIDKYIKKNNPKIVIARASNDEPSRVKLYERIMKRFYGKKYEVEKNSKIFTDFFNDKIHSIFAVWIDDNIKWYLENHKETKKIRKKKKI